MTDYTTTWQAVERLLREASARLSRKVQGAKSTSTDLPGTFGEFEEFLSHNELELAWDVLAEVGWRENADSEFWSLLAGAAGRMQLPDKAEEASRRAVQSNATAVD